jgi:hypothetical protein
LEEGVAARASAPVVEKGLPKPNIKTAPSAMMATADTAKKRFVT